MHSSVSALQSASVLLMGVVVGVPMMSSVAFAEDITDSGVTPEAIEKIIEYVSKEVAAERAAEEKARKQLSSDAYIDPERRASEVPIEMPLKEPRTVSAKLVQGTVSVYGDVLGTYIENTSHPEFVSQSDAKPDVVQRIDLSKIVKPAHIVVPLGNGEVGGETVAVLPGPASVEVVKESLGAPVDEGEVLGVSDSVSAPPTPSFTVFERLHVVKMTPSHTSVAPRFRFEFTGEQIKTKRASKSRGSDIGMPVIDAIEGTTSISGSCASTYYVIALYKYPADYEEKPDSAVVHKSYLCIGGEYSFALNKLPARLQSGTYYLIVGEQGDSGPWKPLTDLNEIIISKLDN